MRRFLTSLIAVLTVLVGFAPASRGADDPVSYYRQVKPLLNQTCAGCHKPEKSKGDLDLTVVSLILKGGKHGAAITPGDAVKSKLIEMVSGDDPDMPKDADPLSAGQVSLLTRWVQQGAKDDTPPPGSTHIDPPIYIVPPVISSMKYSPDGSMLAVSGWHEALLVKSDGSGLIGRLTGECPRIESLAFTRDGKTLGVAGGAPAEFGQVQIWDVASQKATHTFQPSADSLYGLSFAPDGKSVAVGAADKSARQIEIDDGKLLIDFKAHSDWVMGTVFSLDGKQLVTAGRDRACKLVEVGSARFIDDINNPLEPIMCLTRHPKEELILYGGALGNARIYKISDNQGRTAGRNDTNLVIAFERQPSPVTAVAFSPDGNTVALGTTGLVKVYARDGRKLFELSGHPGPVYAVDFKPDGSTIATGGSDGAVRLFDAKSGNLIKQFVAAPITPTGK